MPSTLEGWVMEPVKLLERAASTAVHTIRHPIASVAYVTGMARGLAGAVIHGATVSGHDPHAGPQPVPPQRAAEEQPPTREPLAAVIDPPAPEPPGEQFVTEPKAVSRQSEHGGPGNDAEIDDWELEAAVDDGLGVETPAGTTGAAAGHNPDTAEAGLQQPDTEPLLDPATAKAIRSESAMMRKDAERDPE